MTKKIAPKKASNAKCDSPAKDKRDRGKSTSTKKSVEKKVSVIKHGTNHNDFAGKYTCIVCECVFEISSKANVFPKEVEIIIDHKEETVTLRAHKCPECNADVILNLPGSESD